MVLLASVLALSACNGDWSDEEFQEAVEYCEELLASPLQNAQCDHSVTLLRDDLGCSLDAVYEFIDLTSRLDYEGGRAVLDNGCDNPSGDIPGLPSE